MFLYSFKLYYIHNNKECCTTYNKFCIHPKKTKLYKNLLNLVNDPGYKATKLETFIDKKAPYSSL